MEYYEDGKVVFLRHSLLRVGDGSLKNYPRIFSRINEISLSCNFMFSFCAPYYEESNGVCDGYVVIYFDAYKPPSAMSPSDPLSYIEGNSEKILGLANVILFVREGLAEIYNVCTLKQARGTGVAKTIFEKIAKNYIYDTMWLAVALSNPLFETVVRLYAKAGFGEPVLTTRSSRGAPLNFPIIGLTYRTKRDGMSGERETTVVNVEEVVELASKMKDAYFVELGRCSSLVHLSLPLLEYIKESLQRDREYGGAFLVEKYVRNPVNRSDVNEYANLVVDTEAIVRGNDPPDYTVPMEMNSRIMWHTHPEVCYKHYDCFITWPSGPDTALLVSEFERGLRKQYVFTTEGVWSMQLSPNFMAFIKGLTESNYSRGVAGAGGGGGGVRRGDSEETSRSCIRKFSRIVYYVFAVIEQHRKATDLKSGEVLNKADHERIYQRYVELTNTFTFSQLVRAYNEEVAELSDEEKGAIQQCRTATVLTSDFLLFQIRLFTWREIEAAKGIIDVVTTVDDLCPLSPDVIEEDTSADGDRYVGTF